jgi:hypothetical protein
MAHWASLVTETTEMIDLLSRLHRKSPPDASAGVRGNVRAA